METYRKIIITYKPWENFENGFHMILLINNSSQHFNSIVFFFVQYKKNSFLNKISWFPCQWLFVMIIQKLLLHSKQATSQPKQDLYKVVLCLGSLLQMAGIWANVYCTISFDQISSFEWCIKRARRDSEQGKGRLLLPCNCVYPHVASWSCNEMFFHTQSILQMITSFTSCHPSCLGSESNKFKIFLKFL